MAEFYVEQQGWAHWPKVLIMCRKNGRNVTRRRYVPEVETGEGMSITDELREWWVSKFPVMDSELHKDFTAIAGRIDAKHEEAIQQALMGEGSVPATDENMAECGWIRLPVDADGEPIRVGDVVDVMPTDKLTGHKNVVVTSVIFKRSAVLVTVDTDDRPFTFMPNRICHYHAPTVEDVLTEFGIDWEHESDCEDRAALLAEYAAKLRLAGDAE